MDELVALEVMLALESRIRTQVNMCHGSRNINDATNHMTYVAARDTTIVKNCSFLNTSSSVKFLFCTCFSIDFTVTKTAANARYIMIQIQKYTIVM